MRLWLDCEFNGCHGALMSVGMVSQHDDEFYEVCALPPGVVPVPWVQDNVVPLLGKEAIPREKLQAKLMGWLNAIALGDAPFEFVVDHPADAIHLCQLLEVGDNGEWLDIGPFTITFVTGLPGTASNSEIPHHALEDAKALRESHLATLPSKYADRDE